LVAAWHFQVTEKDFKCSRAGRGDAVCIVSISNSVVIRRKQNNNSGKENSNTRYEAMNKMMVVTIFEKNYKKNAR
jgi:hypothetical protein